MSALQHDALAAALREDYGEVIVAVFSMPLPDLVRLVDAMQMIEREADDRFDALDAERRLVLVGRAATRQERLATACLDAVEAIRSYIVAIGRAPRNRVQAEVDGATERLVAYVLAEDGSRRESLKDHGP